MLSTAGHRRDPPCRHGREPGRTCLPGDRGGTRDCRQRLHAKQSRLLVGPGSVFWNERRTNRRTTVGLKLSEPAGVIN